MSKFRYAVKTYMPCQYSLRHDLQQRLNNTLCTYDGVLYYLQLEVKNQHVPADNPNDPPTIKENLKWVLINPVTGQKFKNIETNDSKLDISAIECGYYTDLNRKCANYLLRQPNRKTIQGFNTNGIRMKSIDGSPGGPWDLIGNVGLIASLYNDYPSFRKAQEMMKNGFRSVALSRDVAIERNRGIGLTLIYFKTQNIGYFDENQNLRVPEKAQTWIVRKGLNEVFK